MGSIGRADFSDLLLRVSPGLETCYRTGTRKSLLAAIAAGELDFAVYPGAAGPERNTTVLCEDRLVVAVGSGHRLAQTPTLDPEKLRGRMMLLPAEGSEGDFRCLARALIPGLGGVSGVSMQVLVRRLAASEELGLVAAGQRDEMGEGAVTRPFEGLNTAFPVHLTWSKRVAHLGFGELLAGQHAISPTRPICVMGRPGRRGDDASAGAGGTVLA